MAELNVALAGATWKALHQAVCRDAVKRPDLVVLLATCDNVMCGLVVSIIHWHRYWRHFLLRHPLLGAAILLHRLVRRRQALMGHVASGHQGPGFPAEGFAEASEAFWQQSSPEIAKIAFVGVLPAWRGRGIAGRLYEQLSRDLAERGVRRVDARIDQGNLSSIRLHLKAAWRIAVIPDALLASISLPPSSPGNQGEPCPGTAGAAAPPAPSETSPPPRL